MNFLCSVAQRSRGPAPDHMRGGLCCTIRTCGVRPRLGRPRFPTPLCKRATQTLHCSTHCPQPAGLPVYETIAKARIVSYSLQCRMLYRTAEGSRNMRRCSQMQESFHILCSSECCTERRLRFASGWRGAGRRSAGPGRQGCPDCCAKSAGHEGRASSRCTPPQTNPAECTERRSPGAKRSRALPPSGPQGRPMAKPHVTNVAGRKHRRTQTSQKRKRRRNADVACPLCVGPRGTSQTWPTADRTTEAVRQSSDSATSGAAPGGGSHSSRGSGGKTTPSAPASPATKRAAHPGASGAGLRRMARRRDGSSLRFLADGSASGPSCMSAIKSSPA